MSPTETHLVLTLPLVGFVLLGWLLCELLIRWNRDAIDRDAEAEPEPADWWSSDDVTADLREAAR